MTTAIYGVPVAPAALADEKGNAVVVQSVANIHSLEHILRPVRLTSVSSMLGSGPLSHAVNDCIAQLDCKSMCRVRCCRVWHVTLYL